jgi:DNA-binding LacI/PurR family transcriptional regulator
MGWHESGGRSKGDRPVVNLSRAPLEIPTRSSLISQTADAIRQGIREGVWTDFLPGERGLCDHLKVSRPTLRAAFEVLQREGVVSVSHGRRRKILKGTGVHRSETNRVCVLSEIPLHRMPPVSLFYLNELRRHLQDTHLQMDVLSPPGLERRRDPDALLDKLVRDHPGACWLLTVTNREVQEWFLRNGVPSLVAGTCYEGVNLPSFDIDYQAVCRHAAGAFVRRGHRRVLMVVPDRATPARDASEAGFQEGMTVSNEPGVRSQVLRHDGTCEDICRKLGVHLRQPEAPTGILVCKPLNVLTVFTYLQRSGFRMPENISLVSRDSDTYLEHLTPRLTRYSFRRRNFGSRLSRMVLQLAQSGALPYRPYRFIPGLEDGETLGEAPRSAGYDAIGRST